MKLIEMRRQLLHQLRQAGIEPGEAQAQTAALLSHCLGMTTLTLALSPEAVVDEQQQARLQALSTQLAAGQPLQYLLGECEFFGHRFRCREGVLIPRGDSECLIEHALTRLQAHSQPLIVDICCGSGCLGLTLLLELPQARLLAGDLFPAPLELTRDNIALHGLQDRAELRQGDLLAPLAGERCDLIICNPPYIASAELASLPQNVRQEPPTALDGGADGLNFYRRLLAQAQLNLRPNGLLLLEHGDEQRPALVELAQALGWRVDTLINDNGGRHRGICLSRMDDYHGV